MRDVFTEAIEARLALALGTHEFQGIGDLRPQEFFDSDHRRRFDELERLVGVTAAEAASAWGGALLAGIPVTLQDPTAGIPVISGALALPSLVHEAWALFERVVVEAGWDDEGRNSIDGPSPEAACMLMERREDLRSALYAIERGLAAESAAYEAEGICLAQMLGDLHKVKRSCELFDDAAKGVLHILQAAEKLEYPAFLRTVLSAGPEPLPWWAAMGTGTADPSTPVEDWNELKVDNSDEAAAVYKAQDAAEELAMARTQAEEEEEAATDAWAEQLER